MQCLFVCAIILTKLLVLLGISDVQYMQKLVVLTIQN